MKNLPDHEDGVTKTIEPLLFNPRDLDLSRLRELPEVNIAAVTGVPSEILRLGNDQTKPME